MQQHAAAPIGGVGRAQGDACAGSGAGAIGPAICSGGALLLHPVSAMAAPMNSLLPVFTLISHSPRPRACRGTCAREG